MFSPNERRAKAVWCRVCISSGMSTTANPSPFQHRPKPAAPTPVEVRRAPAGATDPGASVHRFKVALQGAMHGDLATDVERVRKMANLFDAKFSVAGIRFGLDGIIGLVPVVGDTVTSLIALYPLAVARRHKLGGWVQARILGNIATDWVVGLVPLVGDLFDVGYKANTRNLRVIERAAERRGVAPPPPPVVDAPPPVTPPPATRPQGAPHDPYAGRR